MDKRKTNPDYVGATKRTHAMARGALIVIVAIVTICIVVLIATSAKKRQVGLIEDNLFIRGDYVNLDGFLRSRGYFPLGKNDEVIRYRKNDGTWITIIDLEDVIVVAGTNIPTAQTYDVRRGNHMECHVRWTLLKGGGEDYINGPGAKNLHLPREAVELIFESEGWQKGRWWATLQSQSIASLRLPHKGRLFIDGIKQL